MEVLRGEEGGKEGKVKEFDLGTVFTGLFQRGKDVGECGGGGKPVAWRCRRDK